jgi:phosphatidylinositol glycan class M
MEISIVIGRSPYNRETYRYTPLLALLLAPNVWLHPSFGKYLFAACDLVNGWLIYQLLISEVLPHTSLTDSENTDGSGDRRRYLGREVGSSVGSSPKTENAPNVHPKSQQNISDLSSLATFYTALHLFNPLVFTISTRGSSESVLALFVLLTLYGALNGRWGAAALMLGLCAHWKIYPIVYGVACLGVVGAGDNKGNKSYLKTLVNTRTVSFAMISAGSFGVLGAGCYLV